ncbi:hypothetical protein TrVFT333_007958 [Trichoderma virens FT-333]|nr:hypothetical protein TrVFT333_007958 [Trichoderma virens FT-333]
MSVYNAASSAGNIIGPLLFNDKDAPAYKPGLRACLAIFVALVAVVAIQWANLIVLNKLQEKKRAMDESNTVEEIVIAEENAAGTAEYVGEARLGEQAFLDLTDRQNDEFVYIY